MGLAANLNPIVYITLQSRPVVNSYIITISKWKEPTSVKCKTAIQTFA